MKRLHDNVHGGGTDSVYETIPYGSSVPDLDKKADCIGTHLEAQGFGNFVTLPTVAGLTVFKPINHGGKYCIRVNYYDGRSLTEQQMADLEAAIRATPDRDPNWEPPIPSE